MHKIIKKSHIFNKKSFKYCNIFKNVHLEGYQFIIKSNNFFKRPKNPENTVCNTKTFPKIILIRSVIKEKLNPNFLFLKLLCL